MLLYSPPAQGRRLHLTPAARTMNRRKAGPTARAAEYKEEVVLIKLFLMNKLKVI